MRGSETWDCPVPCITSQRYQQNSLRLTFWKDIVMVNDQPGCLTQFGLSSVPSIFPRPAVESIDLKIIIAIWIHKCTINISNASNGKYWFEDYHYHLDSQVYHQYFQDQQWKVLCWRLLLPFGLTSVHVYHQCFQDQQWKELIWRLSLPFGLISVPSIFPRTMECIDLKIFMANKSTFTCRWLSKLQ